MLLCGTSPSRTAIRSGDWKLLVGASEKDAEEAADDAEVPKRIELYNLATDIGEKNNLAAANPEKVSELRVRLDAWMNAAVPPGSSGLPVSGKKRGGKRKKGG